MRVVVDTREQAPFKFEGKTYTDTHVEKGSLSVGDYSLHGFTDHVAVERKSLPDLVQCLGRDRDRFEREIMRGRGLEFFAVVCEGSFKQLATGDYRSRLNPHSAVQSVAAFMARHRCPFMFCETRKAAEYVTWSLLRQYQQGKVYELKAIEQAIMA